MPSLSQFRRSALLALLMLIAAVAAVMLRPKPALIDPENQMRLEQLIPSQFGEWAIDTHQLPVVVNPQQRALVESLYSQTLERTYVGRDGHRIMLSIAYGGQYEEGMATHKPEICYPAQGFQIRSQSEVRLRVDDKASIPVRRLVAQSGGRIEPITYWLVVGGSATAFGLPMKLQQVKVGLTGVIPDGLLFRVSTISPDEQSAFEREQEFAQQLLAAIPPEVRFRFIGRQE